MRFLDTLDLYLTENKDPFDLYPVDYDSEGDNASFGVDVDDSDNSVAKIVIRTVDGTPIDALGGSYDYDDVYADIQIQGDTDDPKNLDLISWVIDKLINLGYDKNTIMVDGKKYYENEAKKDNSVNIEDTDENLVDDDTEESNIWNDTENTDTSKQFDTDTFDIDKELSDQEEDIK